MSKLVVLLSGIVLGIYIDQNYDLPKISLLVNKIKNDIKKYEKPHP